ncbi:UNVERIFIED_ORG: hypothetical protein ABIC54_004523 [Burkholderia sp. 1263]
MSVEYNQEKECYVIRFELWAEGRRIRKTKRMPRGVDINTALAIEKRMKEPYDPYRSLRERLLALPDDSKGQGWIYAAMANSGAGPVKIGMTRRNIRQRINSFNVTATEPWVEIGSVKVRCPLAAEGTIHAHLYDKRILSNRELFDIDAETVMELFGVVADTIECINPIYEVGFRATMMVV